MSRLQVNYEILNQKGSPAIYASSLATRPAFGYEGRVFIDTDNPSTGIYRDTGSSWIQVADAGAGTTGTLQAVTTNGNTTDKGISVTANGIGIGTTIPATNRLDIHAASGIQATFNGTGTTNSALQLQSAGVGKWNITNKYNSAANDFAITDVLNTLDRLTITNTGVGTLTASLSATKTGTYSSGGTYGIYANDAYTIPASTSFGSGGLIFASLQGIQSFTYGGNASYQNSSLNASVVGINQIQFTSTGIVTMSQAAGIRTMAAGIFQNQFLGSVNGTIDYLAGLQVLGNYKASSGLLTVTNAYGLLLNNIDDYSTGFTYTNRWGIYQSGASDKNYFAANVLIGTTTDSGQKLYVNGTALINNILTVNNNIITSGQVSFTANSSQTAGSVSKNATYGLTLFGVTGATYDLGIINNSGDEVLSVPTGTVNTKLSGNLLINTSTDTGAKFRVVGNNSSGGAGEVYIGNAGNLNLLYVSAANFSVGINASNGGDCENVRFYNAGTVVGTISTTSALTLYNTTSDYRLKDDFKDYNAIDLISKIKTYDFQWKSDKTRMYGVIAHELQKIIPYLVFGKKDAKDMQSVDYSKLTPILIKAIQELNDKINSLK